MPELPEVETIVRGIAPHLEGRRILEARFFSRQVCPKRIGPRLAGRTIRSVGRRGKFIVLELDDGVLTIHLGMTGNLLLDGERGPYTRALFALDHGVLAYDDIRMFGRIEWGGRRLEQLGPDALSLSFEQFLERLGRRKARIKALLLNQRVFAGLGNIYSDEALFRAGIHPLAIAARLRGERRRRLFDAIREVLEAAIENRGSSVSDYRDAEGRRGEFQRLHKVYGREGEPCLDCATPVRRIVVAQRGTHFCPACQKR